MATQTTQTRTAAGMSAVAALMIAGTVLAGQAAQASPEIAFPYVATTPTWVTTVDEDGGAFYDAAHGRYFAVLASDADASRDASQDAITRLRVPRRSGGLRSETDSTQTTVFTTEVDGQKVRVEIINGEIARVERNGKAISPMEWTLDDGLLEVMDDDGDVIAVFSVEGISTPGTIMEVPRGGSRDAMPQSRSNRPMLGITYDTPDTVLSRQLGLGEGEGVVVLSTIDGLPAKTAGISAGDVIVGLDQSKPINERSLVEMLSSKKPGDNVTVELISRGERKTIELELGSSAERERLIFETDSFFEDGREPAVRALRESLAQLRIDEDQINETVREWRESVAQAEALVREQNGNITRWAFPGQRGPAFTDDDNRFIIRSLPGLTTTPPTAPTPPGLNAEAAERLEDRMQRLEGQMQRLENAIDRLIDAMER